MEELFKETNWKLDEKLSDTYFETFHEFDNGRSYSDSHKLSEIKDGEKIFFHFSEMYGESLKRIEKYRLDVLENECDDQHTLKVIIQDGKKISRIIFEYKDDPEDKYPYSFWNLSFDKDHKPQGCQSRYISSPGWPLNVKFRQYVDAYEPFFDELAMFYPKIETSLKMALKTLSENGLDYEGDTSGVAFSLKRNDK